MASIELSTHLNSDAAEISAAFYSREEISASDTSKRCADHQRQGGNGTTAKKRRITPVKVTLTEEEKRAKGPQQFIERSVALDAQLARNVAALIMTNGDGEKGGADDDSPAAEAPAPTVPGETSVPERSLRDIDLRPYMAQPQGMAAAAIGMSIPTLSKALKRAFGGATFIDLAGRTRVRKWPFRMLRKVCTAISGLMAKNAATLAETWTLDSMAELLCNPALLDDTEYLKRNNIVESKAPALRMFIRHIRDTLLVPVTIRGRVQWPLLAP